MLGTEAQVPRYLVTTHRDHRASAPAASDAAASEPGVTIVNSTDPHMVTIDASEDAASRLREKLKGTHYVEPEVRRSLT